MGLWYAALQALLCSPSLRVRDPGPCRRRTGVELNQHPHLFYCMHYSGTDSSLVCFFHRLCADLFLKHNVFIKFANICNPNLHV